MIEREGKFLEMVVFHRKEEPKLASDARGFVAAAFLILAQVATHGRSAPRPGSAFTNIRRLPRPLCQIFARILIFSSRGFSVEAAETTSFRLKMRMERMCEIVFLTAMLRLGLSFSKSGLDRVKIRDS